MPRWSGKRARAITPAYRRPMNTSSIPPVTCPYCKVSVSEKRIEQHKKTRCPKAPNDIKSARPPRESKGSRSLARFNALTRLLAEPRVVSSPTPQDEKINSSAIAARIGEGLFQVHDVLRSGGTWTYELQTECSYCRRILSVRANGPTNMPQYARGEACRVALLEHLRTEHPPKI